MPIFAIHAQPLHCRDVGEGVPILFGHGYLWDGTLWNAQVDALSETHPAQLLFTVARNGFYANGANKSTPF